LDGFLDLPHFHERVERFYQRIDRCLHFLTAKRESLSSSKAVPEIRNLKGVFLAI